MRSIAGVLRLVSMRAGTNVDGRGGRLGSGTQRPHPCTRSYVASCLPACPKRQSVTPLHTILPVGIYDNSLRDLIAGHPRALAEFLLGENLAGDSVRYGPTELAGETIRTDTIIEIGSRCLHVEFQLRAAPADIEPRLVAYWTRLSANYGGVAPEQHVVVLDPGGGRLSGAYRSGRLSLEYAAHHLWDYSADELLASPVLFPLAVLGRTARRDQVIELVLARSREQEDFSMAERISRNALTLANIYVSRPILETLLRRTSMPIDLRELPMIREAMDEGRKEGRERGLVEGREQGREEGIREALVAVAAERFGALPTDVVVALRDPELDVGSATRLVACAGSIDDLVTDLHR